jgi:hypothetical protein
MYPVVSCINMFSTLNRFSLFHFIKLNELVRCHKINLQKNTTLLMG